MPASELEEDAEGREDDGEDDVDAVGRPLVRHLPCLTVGAEGKARGERRLMEGTRRARQGGRERSEQRVLGINHAKTQSAQQKHTERKRTPRERDTDPSRRSRTRPDRSRSSRPCRRARSGEGRTAEERCCPDPRPELIGA